MPSFSVNSRAFDSRRGPLASNLDPARLHLFWNLAPELDCQQAVLQRRSGDLHVVGQLETTLKCAPGDATMKILVFGLLGLLATDHEQILLLGHRQIASGEAGNRDRDAVLVIAKLRNVIGWPVVDGRPLACIIQQIEDAVEADARPIER